ncbi:hypothetical protein [Kineococcus arenarius]|uniref:hypothetical protein n=1 Tax=unclassified Kineococcus TaxID=2621656 RepID=UPI003D7CF048
MKATPDKRRDQGPRHDPTRHDARRHDPPQPRRSSLRGLLMRWVHQQQLSHPDLAAAAPEMEVFWEEGGCVRYRVVHDLDGLLRELRRPGAPAVRDLQVRPAAAGHRSAPWP